MKASPSRSSKLRAIVCLRYTHRGCIKGCLLEAFRSHKATCSFHIELLAAREGAQFLDSCAQRELVTHAHSVLCHVNFIRIGPIIDKGNDVMEIKVPLKKKVTYSVSHLRLLAKRFHETSSALQAFESPCNRAQHSCSHTGRLLLPVCYPTRL